MSEAKIEIRQRVYEGLIPIGQEYRFGVELRLTDDETRARVAVERPFRLQRIEFDAGDRTHLRVQVFCGTRNLTQPVSILEALVACKNEDGHTLVGSGYVPLLPMHEFPDAPVCDVGRSITVMVTASEKTPKHGIYARCVGVEAVYPRVNLPPPKLPEIHCVRCGKTVGHSTVPWSKDLVCVPVTYTLYADEKHDCPHGKECFAALSLSCSICFESLGERVRTAVAERKLALAKKSLAEDDGNPISRRNNLILEMLSV